MLRASRKRLQLNSIFKANINGTDPTRLTAAHHEDTLAAYSPDGSKILFMSDRESPGGFDIWAMDADGSNQKLLIKDGGIPNWGPNRRIAEGKSAGAAG